MATATRLLRPRLLHGQHETRRARSSRPATWPTQEHPLQRVPSGQVDDHPVPDAFRRRPLGPGGHQGLHRHDGLLPQERVAAAHRRGLGRHRRRLEQAVGFVRPLLLRDADRPQRPRLRRADDGPGVQLRSRLHLDLPGSDCAENTNVQGGPFTEPVQGYTPGCGRAATPPASPPSRASTRTSTASDSTRRSIPPSRSASREPTGTWAARSKIAATSTPRTPRPTRARASSSTRARATRSRPATSMAASASTRRARSTTRARPIRRATARH